MPVWFRLAAHARLLVQQALAILLDADTCAPRPLDDEIARAVERSIQIAEACAARAVWLLAFAQSIAANHRAPRSPPPFRIVPADRPLSGEDLALRALRVLDQLDAIHRSARRLAFTIAWDAASGAHPSHPLDTVAAFSACAMNLAALTALAGAAALAHPSIPHHQRAPP